MFCKPTTTTSNSNNNNNNLPISTWVKNLRKTRLVACRWQALEVIGFLTSPVWPDVGIKIVRTFSKVAKEVAKTVFTWNLSISKWPKKFAKYVCYFCKKMSPKTFKNRPIWSHCFTSLYLSSTNISYIFTSVVSTYIEKPKVKILPFKKRTNGGHHFSVVLSAPTILWTLVQIPSPPSTLFQFVLSK